MYEENIEKPDLDEQMALDFETVIKCLAGLSAHFGIGFDVEGSLPEIGHIAGYLSKCRGKEDILACMADCYERKLNDKFMSRYFGRCINSAETTN
jgi:hypothetical protein